MEMENSMSKSRNIFVFLSNQTSGTNQIHWNSFWQLLTYPPPPVACCRWHAGVHSYRWHTGVHMQVLQVTCRCVHASAAGDMHVYTCNCRRWHACVYVQLLQVTCSRPHVNAAGDMHAYTWNCCRWTHATAAGDIHEYTCNCCRWCTGLQMQLLQVTCRWPHETAAGDVQVYKCSCSR